MYKKISISLIFIGLLLGDFSFAKENGVLISKTKSPASTEEVELSNEFIDIKDAIRLNGTFGLSKNYEKKMKKNIIDDNKNAKDANKIGEEIFIKSLPKGSVKENDEKAVENSALEEKQEVKSMLLDASDVNPKKSDIKERSLDNDPAPIIEDVEQGNLNPKKAKTKSILLDSANANQKAPVMKGRILHDEPAPVIENVEQGNNVKKDDPFLTKKDVTNMPFKFKDSENPVFYFSLSNKDDLDLWKDLRKNKETNKAILNGKIDIVVPSLSNSDVMPIMVYNYALEKDKEAAFKFLDWVEKQPDGWMDIKYADYMKENERKEKKFEIEADIDQWMKDHNLDTDKLYSDRGLQISIAKKIAADTKRFKKEVRADKHPCVYVNGRERTGYFESVRSLPMHQR